MSDLKYINQRLDDIDAEIMDKYPEECHIWLYNILAEKIDLEIKRHDLMMNNITKCKDA